MNYLRHKLIQRELYGSWKKKSILGQPNSPSKPKYVAETFQMQHKTYISLTQTPWVTSVMWSKTLIIYKILLLPITHISTFPKYKHHSGENTSETTHQKRKQTRAHFKNNWILKHKLTCTLINHFFSTERLKHRHKKSSPKQYKDTPTKQCSSLKKRLYTKCRFLTQDFNTTTLQFL